MNHLRYQMLKFRLYSPTHSIYDPRGRASKKRCFTLSLMPFSTAPICLAHTPSIKWELFSLASASSSAKLTASDIHCHPVISPTWLHLQHGQKICSHNCPFAAPKSHHERWWRTTSLLQHAFYPTTSQDFPRTPIFTPKLRTDSPHLFTQLLEQSRTYYLFDS